MDNSKNSEVFLITFLENKNIEEFDKTKDTNLLKMIVVDFDGLNNLEQLKEELKMIPLGVEKFSMIQYKMKIMQNFIDKRNI